jgi:uncharacterized membrane protein (UPF0127 family)
MIPDLRSFPGDSARRGRAAAYRLAFVALLAFAALGSRPARALEDLERFAHSVLNIHTRQGAEWFSVWIADTPARSEQGLMYLRWLPPDRGMLFPQDEPRVMRMWMKNTLIPLDMLFVDARGRVVYIQERATPQSEAIISAPVPVKAVLELAGGECARLGIRVGDQVRHRLFGTPPEGPVEN